MSRYLDGPMCVRELKPGVPREGHRLTDHAGVGGQAGDEFDLAHLNREIDADGIGMAPRMARAALLELPAVVFVRGDGWSLGASERIEPLAFEIWAGLWTLFARESEGWRLRPISEYRGGVR